MVTQADFNKVKGWITPIHGSETFHARIEALNDDEGFVYEIAEIENFFDDLANNRINFRELTEWQIRLLETLLEYTEEDFDSEFKNDKDDESGDGGGAGGKDERSDDETDKQERHKDGRTYKEDNYGNYVNSDDEEEDELELVVQNIDHYVDDASLKFFGFNFDFAVQANKVEELYMGDDQGLLGIALLGILIHEASS